MATGRRVMAANEQGLALLNGGGGGAPAMLQVAPYLMVNAFTSDRRAVWLAALGTSGAFQFDGDKVNSNNTRLWFMHNLQLHNAVTGAVTVKLQSATTYPAGPWTQRGSTVTIPRNTSSPRRDFGESFTSITDRYWRLLFEWTAGQNPVVSLGRWRVGVEDPILARSVGEAIHLEQNDLTVKTLDGQPVKHLRGGYVGGGTWSVESATDAELAAFYSMLDQTRTVSVLDVTTRSYEVWLGKLSVKTLFMGDDVTGHWDIDLDYEVLP